MTSTVIALPGFLGTPADWQDVVPNAYTPDIPPAPFWEWADSFNAWARKLPAPRWLAGYSMGGRLALHAMLAAPHLWSGAAILSAHPGLSDPLVRAKRLAEDREWAGRFLREPWQPLMDAWNRRGALASSMALQRREGAYSRTKLALELDVWSLGRQDDLKRDIEQLDLPIVWMAGERDSSFRQIAQDIHFKHKLSRTVVVPNAGHRLLHEQQSLLIKEWPWIQ